VLGAVAERRDDLSSLTQNANVALGAIADENESLDRTLVALAPTMRQANTTFVNLRATLDDLDPLIETTRVSTKDLAPFLRKLRPVAEKAVPVVADLRTVVDRPGASNDLADALTDLPGVRDAADRAVPHALAALNQTQDEIEFARPYTPDLLAWITNLNQTMAYYDADGHYARIQPAGANIFAWDDPANGDDDDGGAGETSDLYPNPPSDQLDAYSGFGLGPFKRCPGAATQAVPGSNPFLDDGNLAGDCDPSDLLPGP
jgi:phospholipid/cholesterol/gamma-HCH transport system substrate-binding protein